MVLVTTVFPVMTSETCVVNNVLCQTLIEGIEDSMFYTGANTIINDGWISFSCSCQDLQLCDLI